jgi:hypothetical protein
MLKQSHNSFRSTTPESIMTEKHVSYLSLCETIYIFGGIDTFNNLVSVDMRRKRSLNDKPMNSIICRKFSNSLFKVIFRNSSIILIESKTHSHLSSTFFLHFYISKTCWIFSDEYDCKHGLHARRGESNFLFNAFENLSGKSSSVENHSIKYGVS